MKNTYVFTSAAALLVIATAIAIIFSRGFGSSDIVFQELGIGIDVPASLSGATVGTSTVQAVGPVAWVAADGCVLGAFYKISKNDLAQPRTRWTDESLKAATNDTENVPQQAKEFSDFYLVFEGSQAACASEQDAIERESALRSDLWRSIKTARIAS